jgi:hypothetical protein
MEVPTDLLARPWIDTQRTRRKHELPAEFATGGGRFAVEGLRQRGGAEGFARMSTYTQATLKAAARVRSPLDLVASG